MNTNIVHVGLDVDDTQYHGSALDKNTGEVIEFEFCNDIYLSRLGALVVGIQYMAWVLTDGKL